jgi:hypothetical protein
MLSEMTSVLFQSGLNYQNGNPIGREVRAIKTDIEELKKQITSLKLVLATGVSANNNNTPNTPTLSEVVSALRSDATFINSLKGEKGEKGEKGDIVYVQTVQAPTVST